MNRMPSFPRRQFFAQSTGLIASTRLAAVAQESSGRRPTTATGPANPDLISFDRMMTDFLPAHGVPGAALAVSRHGRLVYSRGFGYSDVDTGTPTAPDALFRIASLSKPLTAIAVLRLAQREEVRLDDPILDYLGSMARPEAGSEVDPRWKSITIRQLLRHTGGWDRQQSFDPIGRPTVIAEALGAPLPIRPEHIIHYMMGQPLDFDPGKKYAYSNFGYILLGRLIEAISRQNYEDHVRADVLKPLGIDRMKLGRARIEHRQPGEVTYYDPKKRSGKAVASPPFGEEVPVQYGAANFEAYDSHGGWIASAPDLARFASAFDDPDNCPLLDAAHVRAMWERPEGDAGHEADGQPRATHYGCGWQVRPRGPGPGLNAWHTGLIAGTSALLVRRWDGLCWAVLFNTHEDRHGKALAGLIDPLVHQAAAAVNVWP
jgi:CubicO group peptidase (beta-lactamase class C family)